jgi:hypothetical protein
MERISEPPHPWSSGGHAVLILKAGTLSALVATVASALLLTILNALPTWPRPDLTIGPSALDIVKTTVLLCAITVVSCGSFGFMAGVAGSAWLCFRRKHILSTKRLLVEAAVAGFLLGMLYPVFDSAMNSPHFQKPGVFMNPIQIFFSVVLCTAWALICALVFRKRFIAQ